MNRFKRILKTLFRPLIMCWRKIIVDGWYGGIWNYRSHILKNPTKFRQVIYNHYLADYGAWIGIKAQIVGAPKCPHGCYGLFISNAAKIGVDCVIFQHVTIGSVTTAGSKHQGAPIIGNNVYIGAGAKIIGNVRIGDGVRIGANCVVTQDIPSNSVVYMSGLKIIQKDAPMDNTFSIDCLNT